MAEQPPSPLAAHASPRAEGSPQAVGASSAAAAQTAADDQSLARAAARDRADALTALAPLYRPGEARMVWTGARVRRQHADQPALIAEILKRGQTVRAWFIETRTTDVITDALDMIAALTLGYYAQRTVTREALASAAAAEARALERGKAVAVENAEALRARRIEAALFVFLNAEIERAQTARAAGQIAEAKARFETADFLTQLIANPEGAHHG